MDTEAKTILVVDDNPLTARLVECFVRCIGFNTLVAFDGEEAIRHLARQPVTAVISDVEMPLINGFDLLKFIRLCLPELPVILMSATCNAERRETARAHGALALLEKPVNTDHLAELLGSSAAEHRNNPVNGRPVFSIT